MIKPFFYLLLKFFISFLKIYPLNKDKINFVNRKNIFSYLKKKYLNWFFTFTPIIISNYRRLTSHYVGVIDHPSFTFGRFIFTGYYTEDMIGTPHSWYHTIYPWKPAATPLAFERPKLPRISLTKYGFHVPHVPFQFVNMLDYNSNLVLLLKYWYMPRELERLTAQRFWRDCWHVYRPFCKFWNLGKYRKRKRLRRKALRFFFFYCMASPALRGTFIGIYRKKLTNTNVNLFEHFVVCFFKIYKDTLIKAFPKFRSFFLLFFSKGNSLLKFNVFTLINFMQYFHIKFKSFKDFYENKFLFPSIYIHHMYIFIHLELFLCGFKIIGLNPGIFSYYFFFYRKVDLYEKKFKLLKLKFYYLRIDVYSLNLYWSYIEPLRLFKYREYLMYNYAMNFFPILRHSLVPNYLVRRTLHLKRHFKFFKLFHESLRLRKFRIYYSYRLLNSPINTLYFDNFSYFFNSCSSIFLLSKIEYFSAFLTAPISRLYRQHFILYCHIYWQRLTLSLMYKYRLFKFLYKNYMEFWGFLRNYHYPFLFSREFMPFYMLTFFKRFVKLVFKPFKKMYFFLDLKKNLYDKKKNFTIDSYILNSNVTYILSTRRVYITLKSLISTTLFLHNFTFFRIYSYYFHKGFNLLYHSFFDNILLFLFSVIDKNLPFYFDLHRFYFTLDLILWRFFSFDPMINILRKELKNIFIFRRLDIDLILYSRYRVYWDIFLFSFNRNSLFFEMKYFDIWKTTEQQYLSDFFKYNTLNKVDMFRSFLLKILNRSFEFVLVLFLLFKKQYPFLLFYYFKFFNKKYFRSFLFSFQARPLIMFDLNKGIRIYGVEPFLKSIYRENATTFGIFGQTYTNKICWFYFRIKYYWDKPIKW